MTLPAHFTVSDSLKKYLEALIAVSFHWKTCMKEEFRISGVWAAHELPRAYGPKYYYFKTHVAHSQVSKEKELIDCFNMWFSQLLFLSLYLNLDLILHLITDCIVMPGR